MILALLDGEYLTVVKTESGQKLVFRNHTHMIPTAEVNCSHI